MTRGAGVFITFEGTDGSGKTTQLLLLAEHLRSTGHEVVETVEPGGTSIGMQIRRIVLDPENHDLCPTAELLLYFAARAQNVDEVILPALNRGAIVLSDRFTDSTLAYQGAARKLGADVVMRVHDIACRDLLPDLTLLIDLDLEASLARTRARVQEQDRLDSEAAEFHSRVRDGYLDLARQFPNRIRVIDGSGTRQQVADRVQAEFERNLSKIVPSEL